MSLMRTARLSVNVLAAAVMAAINLLFVSPATIDAHDL
jgi:hypothetical protein